MSGKNGFLATALLGGAVYWLWQKARRANDVLPVRDIIRWEDEGGAVRSGATERSAAGQPSAAELALAQPAQSGGATPDAWNFPKS